MTRMTTDRERGAKRKGSASGGSGGGGSGGVDEAVRRARRELTRGSLRAFCLTYLPHYFRFAPSAMHEELFGLLEGAVKERDDRGDRDFPGFRGVYLAVAAPRGHAKSTLVTLAWALWTLCHQTERFIVLISDTADQAVNHLSNLKRELSENDRLREDFPEACEPVGRPPSSQRWKLDDVITRHGVRIIARGAEQKIRGNRHGQDRPTLIIADDLENEELVKSPEQRSKRIEWFRGTVLKAGDATTNVVVVGTLLHPLSLLAELLDPIKSPGWITRRYRALLSHAERQDLWDRWEAMYCGREEESDAPGRGPESARAFFEANREAMLAGSSVLWPQGEPYERLMEIRLRDGRASFEREKQNAPYSDEDCFFDPRQIQYWDDPSTGVGTVEELLETLRYPRMYGACDPSMGKHGRGRDDTAIISLIRDEDTGVMYVVDADIRRCKPEEIIQQVLAMHRIRRYARFAIEEVQYQEFLKQELQRRGASEPWPLSVSGVRPATDKLGRIQSLQPLIVTGMLRFSRRHAALMEQLLQFPHALHDDGPDALQMAVELAGQGGDAQMVEVIAW